MLNKAVCVQSEELIKYEEVKALISAKVERSWSTGKVIVTFRVYNVNGLRATERYVDVRGLDLGRYRIARTDIGKIETHGYAVLLVQKGESIEDVQQKFVDTFKQKLQNQIEGMEKYLTELNAAVPSVTVVKE